MSPELRSNPQISYFRSIEDSFMRAREQASAVQVPKLAIDLANYALIKTYPNLCGKSIMPVRLGDILVLPDDIALEHQVTEADQTFHPIVNDLMEKHEFERTITKGSRALIRVLPIQGRPIIYPESALVHSEDPEYRASEAVYVAVYNAYKLLHETFHRTAMQEPYSITGANDPLLRLAFSERGTRDNSDSSTNEAQFAEELYKYAIGADTHIYVHGAAMYVMSRDGDELKVLTTGAMNKEEGLVEFFASLCLPTVLSVIAKQFGQDFAGYVAEVFSKELKSSDTYINGNILEQIPDYLRQLEFVTVEDAITAHFNNRIPILDSQRASAFEGKQ